MHDAIGGDIGNKYHFRDSLVCPPPLTENK